jgi:hypothetical protein
MDRFFCSSQADYARKDNKEAEVKPAVINVVSADIVGDYRIQLAFDDGVQQIVDFRPFLIRSSHPDIRAYLDTDRFSAFRIEYGELVWGDYDLCFPIIDLYENRLDSSKPLGVAA